MIAETLFGILFIVVAIWTGNELLQSNHFDNYLMIVCAILVAMAFALKFGLLFGAVFILFFVGGMTLGVNAEER